MDDDDAPKAQGTAARKMSWRNWIRESTASRNCAIIEIRDLTRAERHWQVVDFSHLFSGMFHNLQDWYKALENLWHETRHSLLTPNSDVVEANQLLTLHWKL